MYGSQLCLGTALCFSGYTASPSGMCLRWLHQDPVGDSADEQECREYIDLREMPSQSGAFFHRLQKICCRFSATGGFCYLQYDPNLGLVRKWFLCIGFFT